MKTISYKISKGQFLGNIEPFKTNGLPTDSIIHKQITGCGATTLELEFQRNSIIIEPNLPVIKGKADKMNKGKRKHKVILAVYDRVSVEDIRYYIDNRKGYKKIVTTPEGFDKVIEAIGKSVFKDYFLLFDECEKVIQDVAYRGRITDPLKLFFSFDNKAFVSATPILPSDPQFENFTHVTIEPDYEYKHHIKVYPTNNIVFQLKKIIDSYHEYAQEPNRKFFIFFKSTQRIKHIIQGLKLQDYAIYCSEKRVRELKSIELTNAYGNINDEFSKYNFFTSRFFSAVDFDYKIYNCNPIIIMISDPLAIEHSVIDPTTEAIQIIGRFRDPEREEGKPEIKVIKDIYHVTNYNSKLVSFSSEEINSILTDIQWMHRFVASFKPNSDYQYISKFKHNILKVDGFSYFNRDSSRNHFMIDNFHDKELINAYYNTSYGLLSRYRELERFEVNSESNYKKFVLTDADLREMNTTTAFSKLNTFVSQRVKELMEMKESIDADYMEFNLDMLRISYPKQMAIIDDYGIDKAAKLEYDINKIQDTQKHDLVTEELKEMKVYVNNAFTLKGYPADEIIEILKKGIAGIGLKEYKATLALLKRFAKISKRGNVKKSDGTVAKGYTIIEFYN